MQTFGALLAELAKDYGTKQDLAIAVDITPSTLSHLLTGGSPSTDVCLRLAHVTGASPSRILRAAGKPALADMLEDLYGAPAQRRQERKGMTTTDAQTLRQWQALTPHTRKALADVLTALANVDRRTHRIGVSA